MKNKTSQLAVDTEVLQQDWAKKKERLAFRRFTWFLKFLKIFSLNGKREQGEAVAYSPDGMKIYLTSEKARSPLIEVARKRKGWIPRKYGLGKTGSQSQKRDSIWKSTWLNDISMERNTPVGLSGRWMKSRTSNGSIWNLPATNKVMHFVWCGLLRWVGRLNWGSRT